MIKYITYIWALISDIIIFGIFNFKGFVMNKISKEVADQIEQKANNITKKYNEYMNEDKKNGYVDIIKIAQDLGFVVGNVKLKDDSDGFIIVNEKEDQILGIKTSKLIGVNEKRSLEWKRFIIAHEIGHYILHYIDNAVELDGLYACREHIKGKNETENQVDFFAACLLMPADFFKKKFNEVKEEKKTMTKSEIAQELSRNFLVTSMMVLRRIDELELWNEG